MQKHDALTNALVRNSNNLKKAHNLNIFKGDIFNREVLSKAIEKVDCVFHLVAKTHDFASTDNRKDYFNINVEGTRSLLEMCANSSVRHFVYFSSVKAMSEESDIVLDETYNPKPTTSYGESKLEAEKLVVEYGEKYSFKTTVLRLPIVYGPGNKGNLYKMIWAIDNNRFVMMGKGYNKRSMVYVGNVVNAGIAAIDLEVANKKVYIITDGIDYAVKDLYKLIAKGLSKKSLPFYVPMGIAKMLAIVGDIGGRLSKRSLPLNSNVLGKLTGSLTFSSQRIQTEIGFKPKYNLYNTIDETIKWYRSLRDAGHRL